MANNDMACHVETMPGGSAPVVEDDRQTKEEMMPEACFVATARGEVLPYKAGVKSVRSMYCVNGGQLYHADGTPLEDEDITERGVRYAFSGGSTRGKSLRVGSDFSCVDAHMILTLTRRTLFQICDRARIS
jgi:hypothetical protein